MNYSINAMPKETRMKVKESIQRNFEAIRKIAHLEIDELKDLLDVSRQTIYNIEKRKSDLSYPQIVVLLLVLEKLAENNQQLKDFMDNVVFKTEEDEWISATYTSTSAMQDQKNQENNSFKGKAAAIAGGVVVAGALVTGPIGAIAGAAMSSWLYDKISKSVENKNKNK